MQKVATLDMDYGHEVCYCEHVIMMLDLLEYQLKLAQCIRSSNLYSMVMNIILMKPMPVKPERLFSKSSSRLLTREGLQAAN